MAILQKSTRTHTALLRKILSPAAWPPHPLCGYRALRFLALVRLSLCVWHDSFICVTWPILVCDLTHLCVFRFLALYVCHWVSEVTPTLLFAWRDSFICVTWLILVCDLTRLCDFRFLAWVRLQLCVWRDSFICATFPLHVCDVTPLRVGWDSFMCVTWRMYLLSRLMYLCDVTRLRDIQFLALLCMFLTWLIHEPYSSNP